MTLECWMRRCLREEGGGEWADGSQTWRSAGRQAWKPAEACVTTDLEVRATGNWMGRCLAKLDMTNERSGMV